MEAREFKAVLFDFDGVLGNTMEDNFLAWQKVLGDQGIPIAREEYFLLEGMKLKDMAEALCAAHGASCDDIEIAKRKDEYYAKHATFSLYPGAEELLEELSARDIPLGLVTAARRERLRASLPKEFFDHFQTIITNEKGGRGKPFPDPYQAAAKELGVPMEACVVIENAPLGIKAAKSAGAHCIAISSTLGKDKLQEADVVVADIREVRGAEAVSQMLRQ